MMSKRLDPIQVSAGKSGTLVRQDLRKGRSSVYFNYESGGGYTIGADRFEVVLEEKAIVIRFYLKPVDDNELIDERRLHSEMLTEVHVSDGQIISNLARFTRQRYVDAHAVRLQIVSQGTPLNYIVAFGATEAELLPMMVQRISS
ncbi:MULTISPECIES: hypothetical protein [unclassified Lysobacter]|uniref:hypothetical protein n=1 Tax=unclassified Lysobacter TaxID=2635362 RepID=UPI001BE95818|nr:MULTISPECIES: hypothetical protein [unclassified Lysobacter]MBT2750040.1 hypothetical protein [Lysobacter sp. ISL-50]MBT2775388.1 hypothetical protein [Lysobacter sp. ISL-54]MBT2783511.1 hypothetical protein [Lysobacter sp. ISL-52]